MITIDVDAKVAYHHVDVKSAVKFVDLMNGLVACINKDNAIKKINRLSEEDKNNYRIWEDYYTIHADEARILYNELNKLGFCSNIDLIDEEKIDIEEYHV